MSVQFPPQQQPPAQDNSQAAQAAQQQQQQQQCLGDSKHKKAREGSKPRCSAAC